MVNVELKHRTAEPHTHASMFLLKSSPMQTLTPYVIGYYLHSDDKIVISCISQIYSVLVPAESLSVKTMSLRTGSVISSPWRSLVTRPLELVYDNG